MSGFFEKVWDRGDEILVPLPDAASAWGTDVIRGPAITLALARALQKPTVERPSLRGVRVTFDLHSPVPRRPLRTRARVLRSGRRLMLIESEILLGDSVYARARGLFVDGSGRAAARETGGRSALETPPVPRRADPTAAPGDEGQGMLYWSSESGWGPQRAPHQHNRPKAVWFSARSLVAGELLTGFECAAAAADMGNLAVNWGVHGMSEINADATMSLVRQPVGFGIGVFTQNRLVQGPVSIGNAALFDARGVFGMTTISALPTAGDPISYR